VGAAPEAWWFTVERPALVLGSAQPWSAVDHAACERRGVEVVRRRSGGGAVLMLPGEIAWLDVVVPAADVLWDDDVGRAMWWFGDVWAEALAALGSSAVEVHRGPLVARPWSRTVCFDGIGAGEVLVDGAKAVGISQRRTRRWMRLQAAVHRRWRPDLLVTLLAEPRPAVSELSPVAELAATDDDLRTAVGAALAAR